MSGTTKLRCAGKEDTAPLTVWDTVDVRRRTQAVCSFAVRVLPDLVFLMVCSLESRNLIGARTWMSRRVARTVTWCFLAVAIQSLDMMNDSGGAPGDASGDASDDTPPRGVSIRGVFGDESCITLLFG